MPFNNLSIKSRPHCLFTEGQIISTEMFSGTKLNCHVNFPKEHFDTDIHVPLNVPHKQRRKKWVNYVVK